MNFWLSKVPNDKSVTLTFFVVGFIVALLKLLFSGLEIWGMKLGVFSGVDFAAVVGALGGVYALRRSKKTDAPAG